MLPTCDSEATWIFQPPFLGHKASVDISNHRIYILLSLVSFRVQILCRSRRMRSKRTDGSRKLVENVVSGRKDIQVGLFKFWANKLGVDVEVRILPFKCSARDIQDNYCLVVFKGSEKPKE